MVPTVKNYGNIIANMTTSYIKYHWSCHKLDQSSLFSKFNKFAYLSLFLNTKFINPHNDKLYLSIDEPVYPLKGGDG